MSHTHLSLCTCPQSSTSNHSCLTAHAPPKERQQKKYKHIVTTTMEDFHSSNNHSIHFACTTKVIQ